MKKFDNDMSKNMVFSLSSLTLMISLTMPTTMT